MSSVCSFRANHAVLLCLALFLTQTTTSNADCTNARRLFKAVYYTFVEEMRRGAPRNVVSNFFAEFKTEIGRWALDDHSQDQNLGSHCVPDDVANPLLMADGRVVSFQNAIDTLKADGHPPSYLPRADYPVLPPLSDSASQEVDTFWNEANHFLNKRPLASYSNDLNTFPRLFNILYDPHRWNACHEFERWGSANGHSLDAKTLTIRMIGLVVRLYLLGVPQDDAFQLLLHHSAFVFDGMRCRRKQYTYLSVPLVFSPVYSTLAAELTKNLETMAVPQIPDLVIKNVYLDVVLSISHYKAWARRGTFRVNPRGEMTYRTWKGNLFAPIRIDKVRAALSRDRELVTQNPGMKTKLKETNRNQQLCSPGWVWEESATWSTAVEEKCCSTLCYDAVLDQSALADSIVSCCAFCNQVSCSSSHEYFDDYVAIVPGFGELAQEAVPVLI